jgi:ABC-2 type transport system permease protein
VNPSARSRPIVFLVARREILMRTRSRVFRIGTVAMIVLIVVAVAGLSLLAGKSKAVRVGFADGAQTLEQAFSASAAALGQDVTVSDIADVTAATAQVTGGQLDVLVTGSATAPRAIVKDTLPPLVEAALNGAVLNARLIAAGLPAAAVASAIAGANVQTQSLQPSDPEHTQERFAGLAVGIVLFMALGIYGSLVSQGVVEEKANRIVEILVATVRPSELLAGKIIGIGIVGLVQMSAIGASAFVMVNLTDVVTIPAFDLLSILGYLLWFILGFLLYATAYAAVAATVSRQEEVSSAIAPIGMFMVAAYLLAYMVILNPASTLSTVLSILPPFAPILMPVRMSTGDAAAWQVGLALILTVISTLGLTWIAGRIYSNSVLRLGARVRFRDALRGP